MGNGQSAARQRMYWKLHAVLPDVQGGSDGFWTDKKARPFADEKDREQFIHACITVISNNGRLDINNYSFRLLYARREDTDRYIARIVAEFEGRIRAKIEPEVDGVDQAEAFKALKKWVEIKLDRILQEVPSDGSAAPGVAGPSRPPMVGFGNNPEDAPPAYRDGPSRDGDSKGRLTKSHR